MTQKNKFRSLNRKVLTYVIWSALLLLVIATSVSFVVQYQRSILNTNLMLNQLLDTVEDTVTVAAYSKNTEIAKDVLTGLLKNDVVNKVVISSKNGFNLEKSKDESSTMDVVSRPIYSLFDANEIIGKIQIEPSGRYSLIEAKFDTLSSAVSSAILIGLTSLIIMWVMRRYISTPLMFVSESLNQIRAGKEQRIQALKNNHDDELELLRTNINNLLTELKDKLNNETKLRKNIESMEQQLRHMYNASSAGLFLLNLQGKLISSNSTLKTIVDISSSDTTQHDFKNFIQETDEFKLLMDRAIKSGQLETKDFLLVGQNNTSKWVHCLLSKIFDSSKEENIEGVLFDVTDRVEIELSTQHEASHDPLTGLLRRQAAQTMFENFPHKKNCCFLMMDLDGFKQANDTYGHLAGDAVLKVASERLAQCVRSSDVICRLGGDEFLIILYDYSPQTLLLKISERIVLSINQPVVYNEKTVIQVGISIGLQDFVTGGGENNDFESILKKADDAMYEVKRSGKNGYCIHMEGEKMHPQLMNADF